MNRRLLAVLASLALVLAACGAEPSPEAAVLSYTLAAGQSVNFEVTVDQTFDVTTSGDASAFDEEDMPEEMSVQITGTGDFTYTISDGPTTGTFLVRLVGDLSDVTVIGTIDGEPVDPDELPDFAEMGPVDVEITVDEKGNIIGDHAAGLDGLLDGFLDFGGLDGLGELPGFDFGFFGPPLSDDAVGVGDTWTSSTELPGMGEETYTIEISSTLSRAEVVDGVETLVIDTVTTTPLIELDMAEIFRGFFEAFLQFGDPSAEEVAELEAMIEQIRFQINVPASTGTARTWFDADAGMSRRAEISGTGSFAVDVAVPDEETGEIVEFGMNLSTTQKLTYRLVASDS